MHVIYVHARFDDLDLDARSQWVGKGEQIQRRIISTTKEAIRIKLVTTVGHFVLDMTLDLKTFIWLDHLVISYDRKRILCHRHVGI